MKKIVIALATLFAFTACSVSVPVGTVSDKRVEEAHTEKVEIMEEECEWDTDTKTVNGKKKTTREYECEEVGTGEYEEVEHEARYFITLEDKDRNDEEHEVTKEEYDSVNIGDRFDTRQ